MRCYVIVKMVGQKPFHLPADSMLDALYRAWSYQQNSAACLWTIIRPASSVLN
jgi:hypothetical protein